MKIDPPWRARFGLDADEVRATVRAQFPNIACQRVELLGSGWDNDVWLIDGQLTARFPRRRLAVALIEQEQDILPDLLDDLPLPTSAPTHFGKPDDITPHPYNLAPYLPGTTACRANPSPAARVSHAAPLGAFLRGLHGKPLDVVPRSQRIGDTFGRADIQKRAAWYRAELASLEQKGLLHRPAIELLQRVDALASALEDATTHERCWVHGDLYVRHLLVDPDGALCGVIDWGDVHVGDPALDLGIAMTYLPESAHDAFCEAYGWAYLSEELWTRAIFLGLRSGVALLGYGADIEDEDLVREARQILDAFITCHERFALSFSKASLK